MTDETTTAEVAETETGAAEETAAATTETPEVKADQETTAAPEQTTEQEVAPETKPTAEAKPAETTSETKPADRVVPSLSDYVLPEGVPEHVAQFASDNDMTQAQLDATMAQFGQYSQQAEQGKQDMIAKAGLAHVERWGSQKDYKLSIARRALTQNDSEGKLKAMLEETGFSNHPAVIDFFLSVGNSMAEGGFLKGSTNTQTKQGQTAASAMFGSNHPSSN